MGSLDLTAVGTVAMKEKTKAFLSGGCQAVSLQAGKGSFAVPFPSCSLNEYNTPF